MDDTEVCEEIPTASDAWNALELIVDQADYWMEEATMTIGKEVPNCLTSWKLVKDRLAKKKEL